VAGCNLGFKYLVVLALLTVPRILSGAAETTGYFSSDIPTE